MPKKQLFCLLSGLSLSMTTLMSLPLYAQSSIQPKIVAPAAKSALPKTIADATVAQPAVAQPTVATEAPVAKPNLEVTFKDLKTSTGQICLSLFSGPKGFPSGGPDSDKLLSKCAPVVDGAASLSFGDLKPGKYAISAFHDSNNDGKLNKSSFGMPEEGFGFSNDPEIGFSAPSFSETEFPISDSKAMVPIKLRYLN
jgi:uncharacterized protein (DUF2141 family)